MSVIEKYKLKIKKYSFRDRDILLYQTENVDEFLDRISNEEYSKDERFPFFIRVWDSGYYLAKYLLEETPLFQIEGKQFLELGGGSGIVGIAILLLGGKVIFSDYEEDALEMINLNCKLNGLNEFKTIKGDWRDFPELNDKIDFLTASDVFYEQRFLTPLMNTAKTFLDRGALFLLSDPGREYCYEYLQTIQKNGYKTDLKKVYKNQTTDLRNINIYHISL